MRASELKALGERLEAFLSELTEPLGRRDRRAWAGTYVRGLLLDGERKSVEPMAARLGKSDQALQQFVSQSPWPAAALLEGLVRRERRRPAPAYWILDETSFPKAGSHSVGVQRQYCGALGKKANCQIAVSLHRAEQKSGQSRPFRPETGSRHRLTTNFRSVFPHSPRYGRLSIADASGSFRICSVTGSHLSDVRPNCMAILPN